MRKLDVTKLNELTDEDIEQYVIDFKDAMDNPEELTTEDIHQCSKVLTAIIEGPNSIRVSEEVVFECKMLRHTVNNELALRRFSLRRR